MKINTLKSLLKGIMALCLIVFIFYGCSKNDYQLDNQSKLIKYSGSDPFLIKISNQLAEISINGIDQLSSSQSLSWDKYSLGRVLGDSLSRILIPVLTGNKNSPVYLKVQLSKGHQIVSAEIKSKASLMSLSTEDRSKSLIEMKVMGIEVSENELSQAVKGTNSGKVMASNSRLPAIAATTVMNTYEDQAYCSMTVMGYYHYYPETQYENAESYFNNQLRQMLTLTGFPFTIAPGGGGIEIAGPSGLTSQVQTIWYQAVSATNTIYPDVLTFTNIMFNEVCSNDPGTVTVDPACVAKQKVTSVAKNVNVIPKSAAILAKLSSSPYEWASIVNYSSTSNGTITATTPKTDNDTSSVEIPMTWNATNGFSVGAIHNHPGGSAPDQFDILAMVTQLANTAGSGTQAVNFYKENAFQTIIIGDYNYTVMVKDWAKLTQIYITRQQNPTAFDDNIENLKVGKTDLYAIMKVFGDAIHMFISGDNRTDYFPVHLDNNSNAITQTPCN